MNLLNSDQEICFKLSIITIADAAIVIIDDLKRISVIVIIDGLKHISAIVIIDGLKHISAIVIIDYLKHISYYTLFLSNF